MILSGDAPYFGIKIPVILTILCIIIAENMGIKSGIYGEFDHTKWDDFFDKNHPRIIALSDHIRYNFILRFVGANAIRPQATGANTIRPYNLKLYLITSETTVSGTILF
jgi:hypothetical protein